MFGLYLRTLRKFRRVSLRETAKFLGCSAAYLSDVELSKRGPLSKELLDKTADFLAGTAHERIALFGLAKLMKLDQVIKVVAKAYEEPAR